MNKEEVIKLFEDEKFMKPSACDECGGELEYIGLGEYRCTKCSKQLFDDYGKVRAYLEKHDRASLADVANATGLSRAKIKRMVEDSRFGVVNRKNIDIT